MRKLLLILVVGTAALGLALFFGTQEQGVGAAPNPGQGLRSIPGAVIPEATHAPLDSSIAGITPSRTEVEMTGAGWTVSLQFTSVWSCESAPQIHADLRRGAWQETVIVAPGEQRDVELGGTGPLQIVVDSSAWSPLTTSVALDREAGQEIRIAIEPRARLHGFLKAGYPPEPVIEYEVAVESRLPSGMAVYQGSYNSVSEADGRICVVPFQKGTRHRLLFRAAGYRETVTDWLPPIPMGGIDLGTIVLEALEEISVTVRVRDRVNADPLPNARVRVAAKPLKATSFFVDKDQLVRAPGGPRSSAYSTNDRGEAEIQVPRNEAHYIACFTPGYMVGFAEIEPGAPSGKVVELELQRGARLTCVVLLDSASEALGLVLRVKSGATGTIHQQTIEGLTGPSEYEIALSGLEPGEVDIALLRQESGSLGMQTVVVAGEVLTLTVDQPSVCTMNCMVEGGSALLGAIDLPSGVDCPSVRAFCVRSPTQLISSRTVSIEDGQFRLPSIAPSPLLLVGVEAFCSDASEVVYTLATIDQRQLGSTVMLDASRSVVRGMLGPPAQHGYEEIVITPLPGHDLAAWKAFRVSAYPTPDGGFAVYGLPPGPYLARALAKGQSEEFNLEDGAELDLRFGQD